MSVINKALSELDKREKGAQYGKYVPPEGKSLLFPALAGAGIMAAVTLVGVAGYLYYGSGKPSVQATGSPATVQSAAALSDGGASGIAPGSELSEPESGRNVQSSGTESSVGALPVQRSDSAELKLLAEGAVSQETVGAAPIVSSGTLPAGEIRKNSPDSSSVMTSLTSGNSAGGRGSVPAQKESASKENSEVSDGVQIADIASPEVIMDDNAPENFVIVEEPRAPARSSSSMRVKQKKLTPKEEAELLRKKNSGDTRTREKLASLYFGKGRTLDAIKTLDRGIILDPAHYDYRLYLARIYSSQGQDSQAIKVLRQGNPPARGNMDYYATLAGLARKNNDYPEAIRAYQKLASVEKQDGKWYLGLAISLEETGKSREALDAYRKALALYLSAQSRSFAEQRIGVLGGKK